MAGWFKSPSGWPVYADTDREQAELTGRGYDPMAADQVQPAIVAFLAADATPPSSQLPGWALAADVALALADKADKADLSSKLNSSTFTALTTGSGRLSEESQRAASVAAVGAVVVVHGTNAATARPTTTGPVIWFGTVQPNNADNTLDVYIPVQTNA